MVSLKVQKRLAASILKCGQKRVWLDPNEVNEISLDNSSKFIFVLPMLESYYHGGLTFYS